MATPEARLREHGIDAIIWAANENDVGRRKITFVLVSEGEERRRTIEEDLAPNETHTWYSAGPFISKQELEDIGVQRIDVAVDAKSRKSTIDLTVNGEDFQIVKGYA